MKRSLSCLLVSLVACGPIEEPVGTSFESGLDLPARYGSETVSIKQGSSEFIERLYDVTDGVTLFESSSGTIDGGIVSFSDPIEAFERHELAEEGLLGEVGVSPSLVPNAETLRAYRTRIYRETLDATDMLVFFQIRNHAVVYAFDNADDVSGFTAAARHALEFAADLFAANDLIGTFPIRPIQGPLSEFKPVIVEPSPFKRVSASQPLDVKLGFSYVLPPEVEGNARFEIWKESEVAQVPNILDTSRHELSRGEQFLNVDLSADISNSVPGDIYSIYVALSVTSGDSGTGFNTWMIRYRVDN